MTSRRDEKPSAARGPRAWAPWPSPLAPVLAALAALAPLVACTPDFDPASEVKGFRVLAVRAEPPEIAPADDGSASDTAALATLVAEAAWLSEPDRRATVLHVACTPVPGDATATACTSLSELQDPLALLEAVDLAAACADPGRGTAGAITFAGLESCGLAGCEAASVPLDPTDASTATALPTPAYRLPADFTLSALPAGSADRVLGVEVVDLALALDASPDDLAPAAAVADACAALAAVAARFQAAWPLQDHVATLKRIQVRGPDALSTPDVNPVLAGVQLDGAALPLPGGTPAAVTAGEEADLLPILLAGRLGADELATDFAALRQTYTRADSSGAPIETKQEDWTWSWFATSGDLKDLHTHSVSDAEVFTPKSGRALVWAVVRDLRGGVAWQAAEVEGE
jgi:hypothetical protein